jgi:hypothetical protein
MSVGSIKRLVLHPYAKQVMRDAGRAGAIAALESLLLLFTKSR